MSETAGSIGPLDGRVALVTGGARGIGKAIALKLAQQGAKIAIVDVTDNGADAGPVKRIAANPALFPEFCPQRYILAEFLCRRIRVNRCCVPGQVSQYAFCRLSSFSGRARIRRGEFWAKTSKLTRLAYFDICDIDE